MKIKFLLSLLVLVVLVSGCISRGAKPQYVVFPKSQLTQEALIPDCSKYAVIGLTVRMTQPFLKSNSIAVVNGTSVVRLPKVRLANSLDSAVEERLYRNLNTLTGNKFWLKARNAEANVFCDIIQLNVVDDQFVMEAEVAIYEKGNCEPISMARYSSSQPASKDLDGILKNYADALDLLAQSIAGSLENCK